MRLSVAGGAGKWIVSLVTPGTAVALPPDFMPSCPELLASWTADRKRSTQALLHPGFNITVWIQEDW